MEAAIFDIDGTLLDSFATDGDLFVEAVTKVLGIRSVDSSWSSYRHVTDQGVLREIMELHGIAPDAALFGATKRKFLDLLERHIEAHGPFAEVPGALDFVSRLAASKRHFVAYATGAWREAALMKLESAGFPTAGVRISTSSEFEDRVSIMRAAIADAPARLQRITYYGDAAWDRAAASELGWDFVPVGRALGGLLRYP